MPDSFDQNLAARRHNEVIREAQRIRDGLTRDVIDYYYNDPTSEDDERAKREGMRRYLQIAIDELRNLVNRL